MKTRFVAVVTLACGCAAELNLWGQEMYDWDSSWAVKSNILTDELGNKQELYDSFMQECRDSVSGAASKSLCDDAEDVRIRMNRVQPMSMRNYTELGFAKIPAPKEVFTLIATFWEKNKHLNKTEWKGSNPYHNMWSAPPTLVNVQDESIPGGGMELKQHIWESSRKVMEEWTGQHLAPCSLWGIRIYPNNSILAPHVDRNPLVTSAIINVAQDVDEDWPLEVYAHDGKVYNVSMKPGDMVLYESHSILHGRPFPMRGRYYANIFLHFEPIGALAFSPETPMQDIIVDDEGREAKEQGLPPYIIPGSEWEADWHESNPRGWQLLHSDAHTAAKLGHFGVLQDLAIQNPLGLHEPDDNGWHPIHEATRAGHHNVVKFLLENGADVNELTAGGRGVSPLALAEKHHPEGHKIFDLLTSHGAVSLGPEL